MSQMRLGAKKVLDEKRCYELWVQNRVSTYHIPNLLASEGIVNPRTGKPVTPQAIWRAASLYILKHPEQAKADTVAILNQSGGILDEEMWGREMIARARQFLSALPYRQFLAKYPEFKKYVNE